LNSSSIAFMRTPSPPLKKSHHTMVSSARAAPTIRAVVANAALMIFRITSIPPKICSAASPRLRERAPS
jgi:hypothetical protein